MGKKTVYKDGLDDDGYPIPEWEGKIPYVRGSEAHVGDDFNPIDIGSAGIGAVERISAFVQSVPTADSPIETILGAAVLLAFERASRPLIFSASTHAEGRLLLIPQFPWGEYRSDFAIYNPRTTGALLIECDGRALHSSLEQTAYDEKRDAAAHDRGYLVIRFLRHRIHANADECAREVFAIVYGGRQ